MPLRTNIDDLVLGETADEEGRYAYLLDPTGPRLIAAARYVDARGYYEVVNLVADGFGPTLFLVLMQKARREGRIGVSPDLAHNTEEAKRMDERFYRDPPQGVGHRPNPDGRLPEVYLNQVYFATSELVSEAAARRNADRHFGRTATGRAQLERLKRTDPATYERWHTEDGVRAMLTEYLVKSEIPFKQREPSR